MQPRLLAQPEGRPTKAGLITIRYTDLIPISKKKEPTVSLTPDRTEITLDVTAGSILTVLKRGTLYIGAWSPAYPGEAVIILFGSRGSGSQVQPFCFQLEPNVLAALLQGKDPLTPAVVTTIGTEAIPLGSYLLVPLGPDWNNLTTAEGLILPKEIETGEANDHEIEGTASTLIINGHILDEDVCVEKAEDKNPFIVTGTIGLQGTDITYELETPHLVIELNGLDGGQDSIEVKEPETAETGGGS